MQYNSDKMPIVTTPASIEANPMLAVRFSLTQSNVKMKKNISSKKIKEVQLEPQIVKHVDTSIKITINEFFCQLAEVSGGKDLSKTKSTKS